MSMLSLGSLKVEACISNQRAASKGVPVDGSAGDDGGRGDKENDDGQDTHGV